MSQKHIIEVVGGPRDGDLLDLAETAYAPIGPTHLSLPGVNMLYGVPVYQRPDGRSFIQWADVEQLGLDPKRGP